MLYDLPPLANTREPRVGAREFDVAHPVSAIVHAPAPAIASASVSDHPFRVVVGADLKLTVGFGRAQYSYIVDEGATPMFGDVPMRFNPATPTYLRGDPGGGTVGEATLSDNTDYGVLLGFKYLTSSITLGAAGIVEDTEYEYLWQSKVDASEYSDVLVSTSQIVPGLTGLTDSGRTYIFIASVSVVDGAATVTQYRKSDLLLPSFLLPRGIVHPEV